jgi:hypothetical protein
MGPTVIVFLGLAFLTFKGTGTPIFTYNTRCSWHHMGWWYNTHKCVNPCKAPKFGSLDLHTISQFRESLGDPRHGCTVRPSDSGKVCQYSLAMGPRWYKSATSLARLCSYNHIGHVIAQARGCLRDKAVLTVGISKINLEMCPCLCCRQVALSFRKCQWDDPCCQNQK